MAKKDEKAAELSDTVGKLQREANDNLERTKVCVSVSIIEETFPLKISHILLSLVSVCIGSVRGEAQGSATGER